MIDKTVPYVDLYMLHDNLGDTVVRPLPEGYSYRFFDESDTDIGHWVGIEVSSGDVPSQKAGHEGFEKYYRAHIEALKDRCYFLLNDQGDPIGTATAFFIVHPMHELEKMTPDGTPLPDEVTGHLHWVAISEEYKRRGLAKPMITTAMKRMHELGHEKAYLHTQTPSWVAAKIYLDLGWEPFQFVQSDDEFRKGWDIVRKKISESKNPTLERSNL